MWIPFFKSNKNDHRGFLSFHDESTQRITSQPRVEDLEAGFIRCTNCQEGLPLISFSSLSLEKCPHCETPNYIPLKIKNYWLYEPLGGGGMGSVYHAFLDSDPKTEFAIKILPRERKNDPHLIEALLQEAQTGSCFGEHPHLTKVVDMGHDNNEYFCAMEYIEGIRLDRVIDSPVTRPYKQVLLWALQILSAEQHMFECGYLFRDLKPQNIIIDNKGNARLIDYGLAMTFEDAMNDESDMVQGSPYYIPPERIVGTGEAMCSEIYSLGMVIFHILAREPYYSAQEIKQLMGKHVTSLRLTNVASKLPDGMDRELIWALNKMINRTPNQRFQTYKEAASELFKIYKRCA